MASWARRKKAEYDAKVALEKAAKREREEAAAWPGCMLMDYNGPPFVHVGPMMKSADTIGARAGDTLLVLDQSDTEFWKVRLKTTRATVTAEDSEGKSQFESGGEETRTEVQGKTDGYEQTSFDNCWWKTGFRPEGKNEYGMIKLCPCESKECREQQESQDRRRRLRRDCTLGVPAKLVKIIEIVSEPEPEPMTTEEEALQAAEEGVPPTPEPEPDLEVDETDWELELVGEIPAPKTGTKKTTTKALSSVYGWD